MQVICMYICIMHARVHRTCTCVCGWCQRRYELELIHHLCIANTNRGRENYVGGWEKMTCPSTYHLTFLDGGGGRQVAPLNVFSSFPLWTRLSSENLMSGTEIAREPHKCALSASGRTTTDSTAFIWDHERTETINISDARTTEEIPPSFKTQTELSCSVSS